MTPNLANGRASFARISSADGKSYLVPLTALTSREGNFVTLNVDRNRIETSPLRREGMSEEQYGRELYKHYGLSYPWEERPGNVGDLPLGDNTPSTPSAK